MVIFPIGRKYDFNEFGIEARKYLPLAIERQILLAFPIGYHVLIRTEINKYY